jgi:hypothetical protein
MQMRQRDNGFLDHLLRFIRAAVDGANIDPVIDQALPPR